MSDVTVTFLGSGDAFFAGGRHQAGYLVEAPDTVFLLDCGSSTLASMKQNQIPPDRIDTILLSHLHGDHIAGIPFLLLEYLYQAPRDRPLTIAGPPGTTARISDLYRAMYSDLAGRALPFRLDFTEMPPGRPIEIGGIKLDPFRVPHQETEISLALDLRAGGRRILYSGDTGWTEDLLRHSEHADLFICECCYFATRLPLHLDYPRIRENLHRFGSRRLILTHLGREVIERKGEIEIELASDGLKVQV